LRILSETAEKTFEDIQESKLNTMFSQANQKELGLRLEKLTRELIHVKDDFEKYQRAGHELRAAYVKG